MKHIEPLYKLQLSWTEIKGIPQDQQAALAVASYAVSEINSLQKLCIFSTHSITGDDNIDAAITIQTFSILRKWSVSLFEFREFLNFGPKPRDRTDDELLRSWAAKSVADYDALEGVEGYSLVRDIRNEAASHYSFSAAKKNIKHVSDSADCNMYLHERTGNSYYPLGEEVMFLGRLNRHGARLQTKKEKMYLFDNWMMWNTQAAKWLAHSQSDLAIQVLKAHFPEKKLAKIALSMDPILVGNETEVKVPVFYGSSQ